MGLMLRRSQVYLSQPVMPCRFTTLNSISSTWRLNNDTYLLYYGLEQNTGENQSTEFVPKKYKLKTLE